MSLSPEIKLHKGDRVRFVTYEEACEVCGMPDHYCGEVKTFKFPESGKDSEGRPWFLSVNEGFIREYGGAVVTIGHVAWDFGGSHIHYLLQPGEGDDYRLDDTTVCPSMFSGYESGEPCADDPLDKEYAEDLFGFLFS